MRFRISLAVLALGCGDPLVGDAYLGTPAFELHGAVQQAEVAEVSNARLSLFWIGFDSRTQSRQVVEQRATVDSEFARFDLALFDAPPPEALTFDGAGIALVVVYADRNENGALNSDLRSPQEGPDTVLGASVRHLVVYATDALEARGRAAGVLGSIAAGYHLYETDDSSCRFVEAAHCVGQGTLTEVDPSTALLVELHPDPSAVRVPNPAVPGQSGTGTEPGNLYGP